MRDLAPLQSVGMRRNRFTYISYLLYLFFVVFAAAPLAYSQNYRSPLILAPYKLDFARVLVGKTSSPQTVTIFNGGTSPQPVTSITATGTFSETDDCPKPPATLAVRAACEIKVSFTPAGTTASSGTLTITGAGGNLQMTVTLNGTGTPGKPTATISTGLLAFPTQQLGVQSPPQTVVITNTGTEMLSIGNVQVNGDFLAMPKSTCNSDFGPLAPNATCSIQIVFTPLSVGQRMGELSVEDNAEGSPQKVALTGTGK